MSVIKGLRFEDSGTICPKQYEVYTEDGEHVAYIRLRWGILRVDYPDVGGETIYSKNFDDEYKGDFYDDEESTYLNEIADVINFVIENKNNRSEQNDDIL